MSTQHSSLKALGAYGVKVIRRSGFAAAYLLAVITAVYLAPDFSQAGNTQSLLTYPGLYLLAAITAHFRYEAFVPVHRWLSHFLVMKGYKDSVASGFEYASVNYDQIRRVGKAYLDIGPPSRRTERLEQGIAFRQMHTYLAAACVTGAFILLAAGEWLPGRLDVRNVGLVISGIVFAVTSIGHLNRSHALGRAYADIVIHLIQHNRIRRLNGDLHVLPLTNTPSPTSELSALAAQPVENGRKKVRRKTQTPSEAVSPKNDA